MKHQVKYNDEQFLDRLLKETLEFLPKGESLDTSEKLLERFNTLDGYKDLTTEDVILFNFLNQYNIAFSEFKFNSITQMFQLRLKGLDVDIPRNWCFFPDYHRERGDFFHLKMNINSDNEEFFEVLGSLFYKKISEIHLYHNRKRNYLFYLDFTQSQNSAILAWPLEYFLGEKQIKEVA